MFLKTLPFAINLVDRPMLFRLSQKLNLKVKAGTLPALPMDDNPFADWSAHLFTAGRTQYIILCNTKSLYCAVMLGRGITNDRQFTERAVRSIRDLMEAGGFDDVYHRFIAPASGTVHFAKPLNRTITGSLNELVYAATSSLQAGRSPHETAFGINDLLLSALAKASPFGKYGKPTEAFQVLVDRQSP